LRGAAGRFFLSWNGALVRIAFGHTGQPLDKGAIETPRFEVAVSKAPAMALELRNALDRFIAQAGGAITTSPATGQTAPSRNGAGQEGTKES
jgi:hypothetical protein